MGVLDDLLTEHIRDLPRLIATDLVRAKLEAIGHGENEKLLALLVGELLEGGGDEDDDSRSIDLDDDCGVGADLSISFDDKDLAEIEQAVRNFKAELPELVREVATGAAKAMLRKYEREWSKWRPFALSEGEGFLLRLEARWGKGFDAIRMLIELARDIGTEHHRRYRRSRSKRNRHIGAALMHLHSRAVQIAAEAMVLMENGYAAGALARWRTLHEVACVALLLDAGGDELAERYLLHEFVETRKALLQYQKCQPLLGHAPISKREAAEIERNYQALLARFGKPFGEDYGWAAAHLGNDRPGFAHVEEAAGRAMMRSHYKLASQNVHAGTKGIASRLGVPDDRYAAVAGATNFGFLSPGHNVALSLAQICSVMVPKNGSVDTIADLAALNMLVERVGRVLARAQRAIRREAQEETKRKPRARRGSDRDSLFIAI